MKVSVRQETTDVAVDAVDALRALRVAAVHVRSAQRLAQHACSTPTWRVSMSRPRRLPLPRALCHGGSERVGASGALRRTCVVPLDAAVHVLAARAARLGQGRLAHAPHVRDVPLARPVDHELCFVPGEHELCARGEVDQARRPELDDCLRERGLDLWRNTPRAAATRG